MTTDIQPPARLRFGIYEIDVRAGELWREGLPVHLPPQPFKVLWLLARRAGDVVTREEIRQELWGQDTFVDFDGSLNFCINQIRKALRDNAESPHFIHTLPRRGYRFIASVETVGRASAPVASAAPLDVRASGDSKTGPAAPDAEPQDDDGGGGPPHARAGRLYEVVREREDGRRWPGGPQQGGGLLGGPQQGGGLLGGPHPVGGLLGGPRPAGTPGFVRLASSPVAVEEAPSALPAPPPPQTAARMPRREGGRVSGLSRKAWRWTVPAAVLAATFAVAVAARRGRAEPAYERLTYRRGSVAAARFGPAGEIAYSASWDGGPRRTYVVRPGETVARPLDLPERAIVQSVLTSGELAALLIRDGAHPVLALAPAVGAAPREVAAGASAADVSADGAHVAIVRSGAEDRVELPPGREIARAAAKLNSLRLSPAGDRVAFLEHPVAYDDRGDVVTVDAAGRRIVLSRDWASLEGLAWSPDGTEVWFTGARVGADSTLNAATLSGKERVVTRGPGRLVLHDIRSDGAVLLERTTRRMELRGRFGPDTPERDLSWLDLSLVTDIASDGRTLVFSESGEGGGAGYGVFLRATDGAPPVRLGEGRAMTLSPDGRWVLTVPLFGEPRVVALPTGAGEPRTLATGRTRHVWAGWFPDSRHVVFTAAEPGQPLRAFVQDVDGGPIRALTGEVAMMPCLVTPDGRRLLARTPGPDGQWRFHPVEGGSPEKAPLLSQDRPIVFAPDGSAVFVVPPWRSGPLVVDRVDASTGARARWRELSAEDSAGVARLTPPVVTPDGRAYAYSVHRVLSELYLVRGLR